jgi:hypothetical protein
MAGKKKAHEDVIDVETRCIVEQTEMVKAQYSMQGIAVIYPFPNPRMKFLLHRISY